MQFDQLGLGDGFLELRELECYPVSFARCLIQIPSGSLCQFSIFDGFDGSRRVSNSNFCVLSCWGTSVFEKIAPLSVVLPTLTRRWILGALLICFQFRQLDEFPDLEMESIPQFSSHFE